MLVNPNDLANALAALAVPGVVTGARLIVAADLDELHDVERAKVANAVPRRQHEFASGRALLRELLGRATSLHAKIDDACEIAVDLRSWFLTPTVAHLAATLTSDPTRGDRVRNVAEVRGRLVSMTPYQVARELAARRSAVENGRS